MNAKPTPLQRFLERHPDLDQATLAAKIGTSQGYLSQLASGARRPSLAMVRRVLAVLRRYEPELGFDDVFGRAA